MTRVLVLNLGSSSIKYQLLAMPAGQRLADGLLEGIGSGHARLRHRHGDTREECELPTAEHAAGLHHIFQRLEGAGALDAIGHRVVHGGEDFSEAALLDDLVVARLGALRHLAPLHNAVNLTGIRAARERFPKLPQVAVFDTAFHVHLPERASRYALPLVLQRQEGIRRYGFHGLSHRYVAETAAAWLERPLDTLKLITLHLGNGASACAIQGGRSIDTSMGFTPLEGLVMGTRCGDLDPALPGHLAERLSLSPAKLDRLLNRHSGLLGLCGDSDMRRIEQRMAGGDHDARLAFDVFCYRVRKYVGAYHAVLNGFDALVFTAGIGERSVAVRAAVCERMDALGIAVDAARNAAVGEGIACISPPESPVDVLVVPTDEGLQIARATVDCLAAAGIGSG